MSDMAQRRSCEDPRNPSRKGRAMNTYLISTNKGWIKTNDEKLAKMPFTLDEMIADNTVLDHPTDLDPTPHKIFFVTKNGKDYWEFGEYV